MNWWQGKGSSEIEIPIFPLPSTVHFPGTLLPLHVFEPRYRALVSDALEGDGRLAIALLQPGFEGDYYGAPAVYPIACAGRLVAHEKLPDGRYHILVEGLTRISIVEETAAEPYRRVRASLLNDELPTGGQDLLWRDTDTLLACVRRVVNDVPEAAEAGREILKLAENPGMLSDVVSSIFITEPKDRQGLLETLEIQERLRKATEAVGELILKLERAGEPALVVN